MLQELNDLNGASEYTLQCVKECMKRFSGHLYGVEMGVAYGGGIEKIGKLWKDRGTVWGFDTFEGHPKQVADQCEYTKDERKRLNQQPHPWRGTEPHASWCMDPWYESQQYGKEKIKYDYIREKLDEQGLTNVNLVKGLIDENTDISFLPSKIHYALIDLDFPISQLVGWNLLKNRIIQGGFICLHDMIPKGHIHGCYEYYEKMLSENLYDVVAELENSYICILQKK